MNPAVLLPSPIPPSKVAERCDSPACATVSAPAEGTAYLAVLTWTFTLFNSLRVLAYLPTIGIILASGDSSQHSLWTWCTWFGANATMTAWLYEQGGRRISRAVAVNFGNAVMCGFTIVLITGHRTGWF